MKKITNFFMYIAILMAFIAPAVWLVLSLKGA